MANGKQFVLATLQGCIEKK